MFYWFYILFIENDLILDCKSFLLVIYYAQKLCEFAPKHKRREKYMGEGACLDQAPIWN